MCLLCFVVAVVSTVFLVEGGVVAGFVVQTLAIVMIGWYCRWHCWSLLLPFFYSSSSSFSSSVNYQCFCCCIVVAAIAMVIVSWYFLFLC